MRFAWSAVLALGMAATAWAEGDDDDDTKPAAVRPADEEAYRDLEARVRALEKENPQDKPAAQQTWDASKMLSFSTPDGNFTAKIGGRFYLVYKHIFERDDGAGGALGEDQFVIDTARIQLDGSFYKDFFYRIETEAAKHANADAHVIKDSFIGWKGLPWVTVTGGQFKVPFSQEETCSSRFIDFAERSILNRFTPSRDNGLMFSGNLAEKKFEWALMVFNGAGANTADPSDEEGLAGRLMVTPFKGSGSVVDQLRLGFDFTIEDVDGGVNQGDVHPGDITGSGITMFDFNDGDAGEPGAAFIDGIRTRYLVNFSWLYGPASIRAEYIMIENELISAAPQSDVSYDGFYVQGTFLLTGEKKPLENRVKPNSMFDPLEGTWGAFELAARIAVMDVSDAEDAGMIIATRNQETQQITVGLNWWWAPNVAMRFDWEHLSYDEDLPGIKTGNEPDDSLDIFYVRWQIDF